MPPQPPKRLKISDTAPPENNEPPSAAVCNEDFLGFDVFDYEDLSEEEPFGFGEREDKGEHSQRVVTTEGLGTSGVVEPHVQKVTVELKVERASPELDEDSDDSVVALPPRRRSRGRTGRLMVADSDEEDVKPGPTVYSDDAPEPGSNSAHHIAGPGEEFIRLEPPITWNVCNLGCSARIVHGGFKIVLHDLGRLLLVDDSFVARVEALDVAQLSRNKSFRQAKAMLHKQLSIVHILLDEVSAERNRRRARLLRLINEIRSQTAEKRASAADAVHIIAIVQKTTNLNFIKLCQQLRTRTVSELLKEHAENLLEFELATEKRNRLFVNNEFVDNPHELIRVLQQFCAEVVQKHAKCLLDTAPQYVHDQLTGVPHWTLFRINAKDVKVFADLDQVLNREIFQKPLDDLARRWSNYVKSIRPNDTTVTAVNPIYFSLCRSLEELILEIVGKTDHNPEELLLSDHNGWHAMKNAIRWRKDTSLTKCIDREYLFVFRLLQHFDPASDSTKPFGYSARRLLSDKGTESVLDSWMRPFRRISQESQQNPLGIADEFYVWYCQLDDVLHHVLPNNDHALDIFEQILQNFVQLLSKATFEQMEIIRVITHSIGRFIVQTSPFFNSDKAQSEEDKQILQSQLTVINRTMLGADSTQFFRDLMDVFSSYWKNRCNIIENIPSKNGLAGMEQIKKTLLAIVGVALRKNAGAEHVINLFRSLNDLIVDLDDVSFVWFVKSLPEGPMKAAVALKFIEPVDNKWSGTDNQTYSVVESQKFQQIFTVLLDGTTCPKHYVLEVITKLLGCIQSQLERTSWTSNECLTASDQMISSSVLISSIRSSLIYLREQSEYVSFELFEEERIKPFANVADHSQSLNDFIKRVDLIKQSFSYTRKQNEMSIVEALKMFGEQNDEDRYNAERLQKIYQQYSDQFEKYMTEPVSEDAKAHAVACMVRESVQPVLFKEWTAEYKSVELPKILAGVAAVWSTMVSADVSSTGKYFKPHCIQILCVLRLFGADSGEKGVSKHLAQVLTGQGKSLVLALIAVVLALTGHQVQLVCYNKHLVQRDASDFAELFTVFGVKDAIQYGTFDDMANKIIAPEVDGKPMGLRSLVKDLITSEPSKSRPTKPKAQVQDNSVLLMDEVDVFFTKEYYGSQYWPAATSFVHGLDNIQEQIWRIVHHDNVLDVQQVTERIQQYISSPLFQALAKFDQFFNKRTRYELLVYVGGSYVRKQFTNKSLFWAHLKDMVEHAISVSTDASQHINYKLNEHGVILYRKGERFEADLIVGYKSVFNYIRLKKDHLQRIANNNHNYGYFNLACGSLSYAMLPKAYPLILGVTGTLTSLNQYEKAAIERLYNINRSSIMPSFFGCSNLQFNPAENFTHLATKPLWMGKIFTQAQAAVGANRAVIIFFHSDTLLEEFRAQYCGQFDRLQVLTENTDEGKHEHLIGEAGVAKTATLATRGMGRGVDYKSSVAVEQSGGVHVIQSFFSLDVKEETQIRGRTARKDNRGSYELIVLDEHLKAQRLVEGGQQEVTYAGLDVARTKIALKENNYIEVSIEKNTNDHLTTLAYLQSFFN
ncbi:uncharacterized protein LOC120418419 [Culex pipiens pallens]|uniref:uncharacterized protein LOC120418419 n=1 Tax=Culex pipiens pallens TaxID=42434 RepID=UPI0019543587|nr:uncharacterized protein LOC120418419 [Culex pipiens pallens]